MGSLSSRLLAQLPVYQLALCLLLRKDVVHIQRQQASTGSRRYTCRSCLCICGQTPKATAAAAIRAKAREPEHGTHLPARHQHRQTRPHTHRMAETERDALTYGQRLATTPEHSRNPYSQVHSEQKRNKTAQVHERTACHRAQTDGCYLRTETIRPKLWQRRLQVQDRRQYLLRRVLLTRTAMTQVGMQLSYRGCSTSRFRIRESLMLSATTYIKILTAIKLLAQLKELSSSYSLSVGQSAKNAFSQRTKRNQKGR